MSIDQLKSALHDRICGLFPDLVIVIKPLGSDSGHLLAQVFGVDPEDVRAIKSLILDLDIEISDLGEFAVTPLVVDLAKTKEFYPQYLPACATAVQGTFFVGDLSWHGGPFDLVLAAANEELALAA